SATRSAHRRSPSRCMIHPQKPRAWYDRRSPRSSFDQASLTSKASFGLSSVGNGMEALRTAGAPSPFGQHGKGAIMIKKAAGGYKVLSEKGKNLGGPYKTKKEAEKRLRQVEFFKHKK